MTDAIDAETLRDEIEQAISDSIDMDWQASWGADAVMRLPIIAELPNMIRVIRELSDDLEVEVKDRWGYDERLKRQFDRDMAPVLEARAILARIDGGQS